MNRVPMTAAGAEQLQEELNDLKKVQRPKVVAAIAEAREHGDLKENAEYHAAREQQGFIEGRIQEIEAKLSNSQIVDISKITNTGKIIFGSTVVLINLEDGKDTEVRYQIVGDDEADIKQNKLSINSPIARGLIGKEEGDIADIQTPGGKVEYEVADRKSVV